MRHQVTVDIAASAATVWQTLCRVEEWPQWTPTMSKVVPRTPGPLSLGSVVELAQPGQPTRLWTVTDLVAERCFTWRAEATALRFSAEHEVTASGDGCAVRLAFEVTGLAAWPVWLLAGAGIRRMVDTEAHSLRRRCQGDA